jgi:UDP-N-acetyl-D-glucosamine dehydrogenase
MGIAYKRNIDDVRESPALDVMHLLASRGAIVTFTDPYVPSVRLESGELYSTAANAAVTKADCVVIITDHASFDYPELVERAHLIVDTRNALKGVKSDKVVRL